MRGFFSFFAILSIVLIAFYLAAASQKNRETHEDSESLLLLADSLHYEKQNLKGLFWGAAASGTRTADLQALEEGLRAKGMLLQGLDGPVHIVDKCPFITEKRCVLLTSCEGNECEPGSAGFRAEIRKPFSSTEFKALAGEYLALE